MQRARPLEIIGDLRWSAIIVAVLAALGGVSLLARRWWEVARQTQLPTEASYMLEWLGLRDALHSGWFIFGLALLALNLLARLLAFAVHGRQAESPPPSALSVYRKGGKTGADAKLEQAHVEYESNLSREEFREWIRKTRPKARFVRDEGGVTELQASWREGAPLWALGLVFHLGILLALAGATQRIFSTPSARLQAEMGRPVDFVELVAGRAPKAWEAWSGAHAGRAASGFFKPGWSVTLAEIGADRDRAQARLSVGESELLVSQGRATRHGGFRWFLETVGKGSGETLVIVAQDREQGTQVRLEGLAVGAVARRPEFEIRVLRVVREEEKDEGEDSAGPWVELEYTPAPSGEEAAMPEVFPLFVNHPEYDAVKRKASRWHFSWEGSSPSRTAGFLLVGEKGRLLVWLGLLLSLLAAFCGLIKPPTEHWCAWKQKHVVYLASSYFAGPLRLLVPGLLARFGLWIKRRDPASQKLAQSEGGAA